MPPKKGETECKNKEDFSLLQIFGKVFSSSTRLAAGLPFRKRVQKYGFFPYTQTYRTLFLMFFLNLFLNAL